MLTVLPVSAKGISYGIWVLKSLIRRNEDNVAAIIQVGGEADEEHPTSSTTFIVLMMKDFSFTAFVSDRSTSPASENYSGTGSAYYEEFHQFMLDFQGEVIGMPGMSSNSREVNQHGIRAACFGFSWDNFFDSICHDFDCPDENIMKQDFYRWTTNRQMEAYKVFLINSVFTHLWEIIPPSR